MQRCPDAAAEPDVDVDASSTPPTDAFATAPNTDDENFSECDSEPDGSFHNFRSCAKSPDTSPGEELSNKRTSSFDSMSSTHSSSSGSVPHLEFPLGRRIVVKPLDEPDDNEGPNYRWLKETPIEREIRLAREREEELRREKGLPSSPANNSMVSKNKQEIGKLSNHKSKKLNDSRSVQHRIATNRIQQEINEATEREKELHAAGMIQTISEDTVDSKVTRFTDLAEYAIEERERKLRKSLSSLSVASEVENGNGTNHSVFNGSKNVTPFQAVVQSTRGHQNNVSPSAQKRFLPQIGQKGLMQRFLASRGKINPINTVRTNNISPPSRLNSVSSPFIGQSPRTSHQEVINNVENESLSDDSAKKLLRRGYLSAEEKIQMELQEMQKREEELRTMRAHLFAQSQPNLLCIDGYEDEDSNHIYGDIRKHSTLRNSESNPNLLDSDDAAPLKRESSVDKVV